MEGNSEAISNVPSQEKKEVEDRISIDMEILKQKEQLLTQCYSENDEKAILAILKQWPTTAISEAADSASNLTKTNNARYLGDLCN